MKKYTELYRKLHSVIYPVDDKKFKERHLSNFVAMRGSRYNEKIGKDNVVRFMVVGRAVNGWGESMNTESPDTYANEATTLFESSDRFQTEWKMKNGESDPYSEYVELDEDGAPRYDQCTPCAIARSVFTAEPLSARAIILLTPLLMHPEKLASTT